MEAEKVPSSDFTVISDINRCSKQMDLQNVLHRICINTDSSEIQNMKLLD